MTYYWFKSQPGIYYLFAVSFKDDGPDRALLGKVWRGDDGRYRYWADLPQVQLKATGTFTRISPLKALGAVERMITLADPQATFTRENF